MANYVQSGKGFQFFTFPSDLVYYTRIFDVRTSLYIPSNYNGDVFLGAINRYHKIGQIFFLFEGHVIQQNFLEYTQQYWGTFIPYIDTDLPIFIELDGISIGEGDSDPTKHLTPNTQYSASQGMGRLNLFAMIQDILLDIIADISYYQLEQTFKFFAKYKPGLYSQMKVVDQIMVESFRDDIVIELTVNGIR